MKFNKKTLRKTKKNLEKGAHKAYKHGRKFTKKHVRHISKNKKDFLMLLAGVILVGMAGIIFWVSSFQMPDFDAFEERKIVNSTKIYDRTGEFLLYDIHQDIKRTSIPFEEMGVNIKNATIAIEDSEFYNHSGVRITSTIRAIISNITGIGIGGGGSTITQQLIKNTLLTSEKRISRKMKEWVLAYRLDKTTPKDKILELYLNEVPYGGTIYGIEEASKTYFGKHSIDLTIAEAAYLAGIPQSPTYYSPYGKNTDKLEVRKNLVLNRMRDLGFITAEEYQFAKDEVVEFSPKSLSGIKAPHFVFFIRDYLEQKYGANTIEEGGLRVITTIDYELQQEAEKIVKEGALKNQEDFNGSNASLVAMDPKTGQILTMVGSRDYFDEEIDGNFNVATARRQPGSSFKPFIYATAFEKGFTPDTVLFDLPTEFQTTCDAYGNAVRGDQSACYMPSNYDGEYRGPISLRSALAESRNIPAVKLFYLSGLRDSLKTAEDMGISTLSDISRYGLTLVIGGGEVSLLEMTNAYSVFANEGIKNKYASILRIEDMRGNVIEEFRPNPIEVLPKNVALTVSDVLSDNTARIPTFGASSSLLIRGYDVAAKTGTTNNNRDAWLVGYSPNIVVGVWAGNNDNTPMKKGGSALAGPMWNKFTSFAVSKFPKEDFEDPNLYSDPQLVKPVIRGSWLGNRNYFIDRISGKLATEFTPNETKEERVVTDVHNILHWVNKNDITGPSPINPQSDSQYRNWEASVQDWWAKNRFNYSITTESQIPTSYDDVHTADSKPNLTIEEPDSERFYGENEKINIRVSSHGSIPLDRIDVTINNTFAGSAKYPFVFSFIPSELEDLRDVNQIKVIGYDTAFNSVEVNTTFKVN